MLLSTALGLFLAFWSLLYLADFYLRSRGFKSYERFTESTGLVVTPFQIRWHTSRLQAWLRDCGCLRRQRVRWALDVWFAVGCGVGVVALALMVCFLSRTLYTDAVASARALLRAVSPAAVMESPATTVAPTAAPSRGHSSTGLIPVIPGYNVPWEHVPLFVGALVVAGVFHELGHAVAAANEDVAVCGFGVFLVAIYPGAFTEIENDSMAALTAQRKLRVYCAGIWHNLVLALLAVGALLLLPVVASPAYLVNKGVVVTAMDGSSGLHGPAGLRAGYVVYGINYCKVYNEDGWLRCLDRLSRTNYGYCVPRADVATAAARRVRNVHGELQCCGANATQTHLCFYYKQLNETRFNNQLFQYSCLPARQATDHYVCNTSLPCPGGSRTVCVYPALFNSTKLLRLFIANASKPVLFVGFPDEVADTVHVSSYVPRSPWLPASLPTVVELFCKYLVTFSLALALLNAVPCYSLDGQFIASVLLDAALVSHRKWARRRRRLLSAILALGTFLLASNVVLALSTFLVHL